MYGKTRTSPTSLIVTLLALTLALIAGTGSANAAADDREYLAQARAAGLSAQQAAGLQDRVDAYLADLDGTGTQVSPNQIDLGGAMLNVPVPGEEQPRQLGEVGVTEVSAVQCDGGADYTYFCAYQYANRGGANIAMYYCASEYTIPWFTVGSWENNQTPGTRPTLTFTDGTTWLMPAAYSNQLSGVNWAPVWKISPC